MLMWIDLLHELDKSGSFRETMKAGGVLQAITLD